MRSRKVVVTVAGELEVRGQISRRGFLAGLVGTAAIVTISSPTSAAFAKGSATMPTIVVRRREDMLRLVITPVNMTINKATGRVTPNGNRGLLVVNFGPQAVTEKAFQPSQVPPTGAVPARLSGDSVLSFVADGPVSLTLAGLLAWAEREPYLSEIGRYLDGEVLPSNLGIGKPPLAHVTTIEMPWWLVLSPHRMSSWSEQVRAKTDRGRSEVFHSRLATRFPGEEPTDDPQVRTLRAIWLRDPSANALLSDPNREVPVGQTGHPWLMIPTPRDRADIVNLSTHTGAMEPGGAARAIKARVALSPLGGQLVAEGAWDEPGVSSMTAWQQRIWQGRDTYAKVVRRGFLYPWGFKAAQIEEGVRVFRADSGGTIRAFWEKRTMIAVTEPEISLGDTSTATDAGKRAALFTEVMCTTVQTPPLVMPRSTTPIAGEWAGLKVYTPKVATRTGTAAFEFDLIGIDPDGNEIPFSQPLLFAQAKVENTSTTRPSQRRGADGRFRSSDLTDPNFTEGGARQLRVYYEQSVPDADKVAQFGGRAVAFAQSLINPVYSDDGEVISDSSASSQTMQNAQSMLFAIANTIPGSQAGEEALRLVVGGETQEALEEMLEEYHPNNFPVLQEARVVLEDTSRVAQETITAVMTYPREYLEHAMDSARNQAEVYLQQAEGAVNEFLMDAAQAGGVVAPELNVAGLSRKLGNVYGDLQSLKALAADGRVTPGEAFAAMKILGGVTLADLMPNPYPALEPNGRPSDKTLTITSEFLDTGLDTERLDIHMGMRIDAFLTFLFEVPRSQSGGQSQFPAPDNSLFSSSDYVEVDVNGTPVDPSNFTVSSDRQTLSLDSPAPVGARIVVRSYPDPADPADSRYRNFFVSNGLLKVDRSVLAIDMRTVIPTVSGKARWSARGEITDFIVNLIPVDGLEFVKVDVSRIVFTAGSGKSPDVDVDVREVDFSGLLTLVKKLASYLPFGDMLVIDIDRGGITAGFRVDLPSIALGAFAIAGISVGAQIAIPFTSQPVRFGFLMSYPEDPFTLTITGLGGGGYLDQALDLTGIERLAITGFVAAEAKVDFSVASGGVAMRAGFTFAIGALDPPVQGSREGLALTAFASMNGHVNVLGIASASINVYLGLSVIIPADLPDYAKLHGVARVALRVSVAFFSKTVEFDAQRTFKFTYLEPPPLPGVSARRTDAIPTATFSDAWSKSAWTEFCGAFE